MSISDQSRGGRWRRGKCLTSWGQDDTDSDDLMLKLFRDLGIGLVVEHSNTVWPSHIIAGVREGLEHQGMFYKHVEGRYSSDYLSASLLPPWHGWLRHCTPIMGSNEWINFFCGVFWREAAAPQQCSITTDTDTTTIEARRQNLLRLWRWEALVSWGEIGRLVGTEQPGHHVQWDPSIHKYHQMFDCMVVATLLNTFWKYSIHKTLFPACRIMHIYGCTDTCCTEKWEIGYSPN